MYIKERFPLASRSRFQTGGRASYFAPVKNLTELRSALAIAGSQHLPLSVLGHGANVLISDEDFNGVVITLEGDFRAVSFDNKAQSVTAGAGAPLMQLGRLLAQQGYPGCSYMGVIPGSVGGAVRMNAGTADGQEIKNDLHRAELYDPEASCTVEYTGEDLAFGYRTSTLARSGLIVLRASFKLPSAKETGKGEAIEAITNLLERRRSRQHENPRTFGSTFKNPPGREHSAGWYLERTGMKGLRVGGAVVARKHANWILNDGGARTGDVKKIIATGQQRVFETFGIMLEREVVYLPEDSCINY